MATVTGPDGATFDVDDSDVTLLQYYAAEGYPIDGFATVDDFGDAALPVQAEAAPGLGIYAGAPAEIEVLPDGQDVVVGAPAGPDAPDGGADVAQDPTSASLLDLGEGETADADLAPSPDPAA